MAVGKTTLGKILAKKLNLEFVDTDKNIEKTNLMTIDKIFRTKGEIFFREEEEKEVLKSLKKKNSVISLGGGAFINKTIRENILKNAISIWLDDDLKTLSKRSKRNQNRPLLKKINNNEKMITEIYNERKNIYKLANYKIECNKKNKNYIIKEILELYEKK